MKNLSDGLFLLWLILYISTIFICLYLTNIVISIILAISLIVLYFIIVCESEKEEFNRGD